MWPNWTSYEYNQQQQQAAATGQWGWGYQQHPHQQQQQQQQYYNYTDYVDNNYYQEYNQAMYGSTTLGVNTTQPSNNNTPTTDITNQQHQESTAVTPTSTERRDSSVVGDVDGTVDTWPWNKELHVGPIGLKVRKIIQIKDPSTGEDVTDMVLGLQHEECEDIEAVDTNTGTTTTGTGTTTTTTTSESIEILTDPDNDATTPGDESKPQRLLLKTRPPAVETMVTAGGVVETVDMVSSPLPDVVIKATENDEKKAAAARQQRHTSSSSVPMTTTSSSWKQEGGADTGLSSSGPSLGEGPTQQPAIRVNNTDTDGQLTITVDTSKSSDISISLDKTEQIHEDEPSDSDESSVESLQSLTSDTDMITPDNTTTTSGSVQCQLTPLDDSTTNTTTAMTTTTTTTTSTDFNSNKLGPTDPVTMTTNTDVDPVTKQPDVFESLVCSVKPIQQAYVNHNVTPSPPTASVARQQDPPTHPPQTAPVAVVTKKQTTPPKSALPATATWGAARSRFNPANHSGTGSAIKSELWDSCKTGSGGVAGSSRPPSSRTPDILTEAKHTDDGFIPVVNRRGQRRQQQRTTDNNQSTSTLTESTVVSGSQSAISAGVSGNQSVVGKRNAAVQVRPSQAPFKQRMFEGQQRSTRFSPSITNTKTTQQQIDTETTQQQQQQHIVDKDSTTQQHTDTEITTQQHIDTDTTTQQHIDTDSSSSRNDIETTERNESESNTTTTTGTVSVVVSKPSYSAILKQPCDNHTVRKSTPPSSVTGSTTTSGSSNNQQQPQRRGGGTLPFRGYRGGGRGGFIARRDDRLPRQRFLTPTQRFTDTGREQRFGGNSGQGWTGDRSTYGTTNRGERSSDGPSSREGSRPNSRQGSVKESSSPTRSGGNRTPPLVVPVVEPPTGNSKNSSRSTSPHTTVPTVTPAPTSGKSWVDIASQGRPATDSKPSWSQIAQQGGTGSGGTGSTINISDRPSWSRMTDSTTDTSNTSRKGSTITSNNRVRSPSPTTNTGGRSSQQPGGLKDFSSSNRSTMPHPRGSLRPIPPVPFPRGGGDYPSNGSFFGRRRRPSRSPDNWRRPAVGRQQPSPPRRRDSPPPRRRDTPPPVGSPQRVPSPARRVPSPGRRVPSPGRRVPSPGRRVPSPGRRVPSPGRRVPSPGRRGPSPGRRGPSPGRRGPSPPPGEGTRRPYSPPPPQKRSFSPDSRRGPPQRTPVRRGPSPGRRDPSPPSRRMTRLPQPFMRSRQSPCSSPPRNFSSFNKPRGGGYRSNNPSPPPQRIEPVPVVTTPAPELQTKTQKTPKIIEEQNVDLQNLSKKDKKKLKKGANK